MTTLISGHPFSFVVPDELNASAPPERRGLRRDHVKLMILDRKTGGALHTRFDQLDRFLQPGDVLVLNSSRTVPAALSGTLQKNGETSVPVEVRLAHRLSEDTWDVLLLGEKGTIGDTLTFSHQLAAQIITADPDRPTVTIRFHAKGAALYDQIYALGEPIRYEYISQPWALDYYQTVYATSPGSVEMPSAGRAFSWELLFRLIRKGIRLTYLELHTGLSSFIDDRWNYQPTENWEEFFVPPSTADVVNKAKANGKRVIAVGTTVVRALESSVDEQGNLVSQRGKTNIYITDSYPLQIADGLLTGFHEPEASHLDMLSAFVRRDQLMRAYHEAIEMNYLWHEFGDVNLIV